VSSAAGSLLTMIDDWPGDGETISYLGPIAGQFPMDSTYEDFVNRNAGNFVVAHIHCNHVQPHVLTWWVLMRLSCAGFGVIKICDY
jgi:hypothetical protein